MYLSCAPCQCRLGSRDLGQDVGRAGGPDEGLGVGVVLGHVQFLGSCSHDVASSTACGPTPRRRSTARPRPGTADAHPAPPTSTRLGGTSRAQRDTLRALAHRPARYLPPAWPGWPSTHASSCTSRPPARRGSTWSSASFATLPRTATRAAAFPP